MGTATIVQKVETGSPITYKVMEENGGIVGRNTFHIRPFLNITEKTQNFNDFNNSEIGDLSRNLKNFMILSLIN